MEEATSGSVGGPLGTPSRREAFATSLLRVGRAGTAQSAGEPVYSGLLVSQVK